MNAVACIGRLLGRGQRPERREVRRQVRPDELEDPLRADEVAQAVLAEVVSQAPAGSDSPTSAAVTAESRSGRRGRCPSAGRSGSAAARSSRSPRSSTSPVWSAMRTRIRPSLAPPLGCERALAASAARAASVGLANAAQNPSPRGWKMTPPWSATACADQRVVAGERGAVRRRAGLPAGGAALDVGEQERHRPARQLGHALDSPTSTPRRPVSASIGSVTVRLGTVNAKAAPSRDPSGAATDSPPPAPARPPAASAPSPSRVAGRWRRQLGAGLVGAAGPAVQLAEAEVAVGLERAHPQLLGDGERLAVVLLGARDVEGSRRAATASPSSRSAYASKPRSWCARAHLDGTLGRLPASSTRPA